MNKKLRQLFVEDQKERKNGFYGVSFNEVHKKQLQREKEVYSAEKAGEIVTGVDFFHAAMIFQHSFSKKGIRTAKKFAKMAIDLKNKKAVGLYACTIDRLLMREGKQQKYGTQLFKAGKNSKWKLYKYDKKTTDQERIENNVPTLKEQLDKVDALNKK